MEPLAHERREEPGVCEDRGLILPLHEAVPSHLRVLQCVRLRVVPAVQPLLPESSEIVQKSTLSDSLETRPKVHSLLFPT